MMGKYIIGVIGDADIDNDYEKQKVALDLGKLIIDNGYILATGGMDGVMKYVSKGAKLSKKYKENLVIGVLPNYDAGDANEFVDIPITTGLGLVRNLVLVSMSHAIVAIGGGAGTLNEIAAAWQLNKLVIALKVPGWSSHLCGKSIDKRREDVVYCAKDAQEAIEIINKNIESYAKRRFTGINNKVIKKEKAQQIIKEFFNIRNSLEFLGKGNEGFVYKYKDYVYKLIYSAQDPLTLYWLLLSLSEAIQQQNLFDAVPNFEVFHYNNYILIKYLYEETDDFVEYVKRHGKLSQEVFVQLLKQFKRIGWVLSDFKPQNLRVNMRGQLLVTDIGKSFLPFSDYLFESMCRRAFVTYKLQGMLSHPQDFKRYLSAVNEQPNFSLMSEFGFDVGKLNIEFNNFYRKVITIDKKDVLSPVLKEIFQNVIRVKSVFDYGSGHGDIARLLKEMSIHVVAYEPDKHIVHKYKDRYYMDIKILSYDQVKRLIDTGEKFDCVLCSLVLCHPLAESQQERIKVIHNIMNDITALTNRYVVVVICNPLYTYQRYSSIQERILPAGFHYSQIKLFNKKIFSSGKIRQDVHRPLSFYEHLFKQYNLTIKTIVQTNDPMNNIAINNSDFIVFVMEKISNK